MKKKLLQRLGISGLAAVMALGNPGMVFAQMEETREESVFAEEAVGSADMEGTAATKEELPDESVLGEENFSETDLEDQETIEVFGDDTAGNDPGEELFTAGIEENTEVFDTGTADMLLASAPSQPVINSISVERGQYVKIRWNTVPDASGYRLYRKSNGSSWKRVKNLSGTSFTDKNVKFGEKYAYTVKAYKKINGKYYWSTVDKKGKTIKVTLPSPALSGAKASGYNTINITWKKVSGATGYRVYRKNAENGKYQRLATLKNVSSFTDKKAPGGKTYIYTVRAYKKSGSKIILGNCIEAGISVKSRMQPGKVMLSTRKSYTKYDITGDGINDKITLRDKRTGSGHNLTIWINGKKAFSSTQKVLTPKEFDVDLCTTGSREEFVSIRYESGDNDYQTFHKMYRYHNGVLKSVMNVQKALKIGGMESSRVEKVAKNQITFSARGITESGLRNEMRTYRVKNGKLY